MAQKPHTRNYQKHSFNGGYLTVISHFQVAALMSFFEEKRDMAQSYGMQVFPPSSIFFFFFPFHFACTTGACRKTTALI